MARGELGLERLLHSVVGGYYEAYNNLGYGFREHVYVRALHYELIQRGHRVSRELAVSVYYKGFELTTERLDMVVDEMLVVEIKATKELHPSARRQLYNYLRATRLDVGLLLHFGPEPRFLRIRCKGKRRHAEHSIHAEHASEVSSEGPEH